MILCHSVLLLAVHHEGYESDFLYWFTDSILGAYLGAAPAFMFAMGVGFTFSKRNAPKEFVRRGIRLFLLGYVLNFFRYGIYTLLLRKSVPALGERILTALLAPDIFHFAGLAMLLTGLFKKLRLNKLHIFCISLAMSAAGSAVVLTDTGCYVTNLLVGHIVTTTPDTSRFAPANWYIFAASGMVFGAVIRRVPDRDVFYRRLLGVSGIISAVYILLSCIFGEQFLTKDRYYYALGTLDAAGMLAIDLLQLSVFYFVVKSRGTSRLAPALEMSRNITAIYSVHWCILGFTDCVFCYALGCSFSYLFIYLYGVALTILSFCIAKARKQ